MKAIDITNQKFGKLTALHVTDDKSSKLRMWLCRCDCGNEIKATAGSLRGGVKRTCGCTTYAAARARFLNLNKKKATDEQGKQFGVWTVLHADNVSGLKGGKRWLCRCECGEREVKFGAVLRKNKHKRCPHVKRLRTMPSGYVCYYDSNHPNASACGLVYKHVAVMAELLGRPLMPGEIVHHKNGIRHDNTATNLELCVKGGNAHPPGQRVVDLVRWAREIIRVYANLKI